MWIYFFTPANLKFPFNLETLALQVWEIFFYFVDEAPLLLFICGTLVCKWDFLDWSPSYFLFSSLFSFFFFFFFFLYFGHVAWRICWFPNQESKLGLHNWKHQILTTRQPGNFLSFLCAFWNFSSVSVSSSFCIFYQVFNFCFHIFNFQEMVSVLLSVLFL